MMSYYSVPMNMCSEPQTVDRPSILDGVERENIKTMMRMTNARLMEAVEIADRILTDIRGTVQEVRNGEPPACKCVMDAALIDRDLAEHVCCLLKEIGMRIGVE